MTRLEQERRRRGWTQMVLGFHVGIAQGDISQIECRRVVPSRTYLDRLAHVLGIDAESLLDSVHQ